MSARSRHVGVARVAVERQVVGAHASEQQVDEVVVGEQPRVGAAEVDHVRRSFRRRRSARRGDAATVDGAWPAETHSRRTSTPWRFGDAGEFEGHHRAHAVTEQPQRAEPGPLPRSNNCPRPVRSTVSGGRVGQPVRPLRILHDVGVDPAARQRFRQRAIGHGRRRRRAGRPRSHRATRRPGSPDPRFELDVVPLMHARHRAVAASIGGRKVSGYSTAARGVGAARPPRHRHRRAVRRTPRRTDSSQSSPGDTARRPRGSARGGADRAEQRAVAEGGVGQDRGGFGRPRGHHGEAGLGGADPQSLAHGQRGHEGRRKVPTHQGHPRHAAAHRRQGGVGGQPWRAPGGRSPPRRAFRAPPGICSRAGRADDGATDVTGRDAGDRQRGGDRAHLIGELRIVACAAGRTGHRGGARASRRRRRPRTRSCSDAISAAVTSPGRVIVIP